MKSFISLIVLLILLTGCKKQYMSSGPEVDIAKKLDVAYFARDWATMRSLYADTAKVNVNQWTGHEIGIDEFMESLKSSVADYTEIKQGPTPHYEAVVADDGMVYTHMWEEWIGMHKNGKEVHTVVHITSLIAGGKIVWAGIIYDSLPLATVNHPSDTTTVMK